MKKIECIVKHERVTELQTELRSVGVGGMTLSDVRGFGVETTRPANYLVLPKVKVEIYCSNEQVEDLIKAFIRICGKNEMGDGKIAILPLDDLVRIRTGERGAKALF